MPERQCLRKTLEQSAGTEPCRAKGWKSRWTLRGRVRRFWGGAGGSLGIRKTSPDQSLAGGKATVEAGKATGRCSAHCES